MDIYIREGEWEREKDMPFVFVLLNQILKEILINSNHASVS